METVCVAAIFHVGVERYAGVDGFVVLLDLRQKALFITMYPGLGTGPLTIEIPNKKGE